MSAASRPDKARGTRPSGWESGGYEETGLVLRRWGKELEIGGEKAVPEATEA
jgi:hypothetical protein